MITSPTRRRPRRGSGWVRLGIAAALVVGICSAVGYGVYWVVKNGDDGRPGDLTPGVLKSEGNFGFDPPRGWKDDEDLRRNTSTLRAMTRSKPRNHFALFWRDYKTRTPSDAELLDEALGRLRKGFAQVNYTDPFAGDRKAHAGTLGGEPAIVFPFVAREKPDEQEVTGEVFMLTRQGYAYWLFFWGPGSDESDVEPLRPAWANVREQFKLYDQRDNWKPQPRESERFGSDSGYRLDYVIFTPNTGTASKLKLWRKEEEPKDYDECCELALKGFEPTIDEETGKKRVVDYAGKLATVQVMVLDREVGKDAGKDDKEARGEKKDAKDDKKDAKGVYKHAEAYVLKKVQIKENRPDAKFDPIIDPKTGKPQVEVDVGALRGQLSHLRVQLDADNERYGVLAVAPLSGDKTLVIFCDCPFDRRDYWKQEFRAVIATVRRAK